jgi:hypothetical protein
MVTAVGQGTSHRLGPTRVRIQFDVGAFGTPHWVYEPVEQSRARGCSSWPRCHMGGGGIMEQVIERCCGLDVHRDTVVACVRVPGAKRGRQQHVRTFGTTTAELLTLAIGWTPMA